MNALPQWKDFRKALKAARVLHVDFETFSEVDITTDGAHKYAMHKSTVALCMAYAFDNDEPSLWVHGDPIPQDVFDHILGGGLILAWNAQFERLIFTHVMGPKYGWPVPAVQQYVCVMVMGMAMSLPGKLEKAAPAVGLDIRKDDMGRRIMLQLSRPRKPTLRDKRTRWTPDMAPAKFDLLYSYCKQDVRVEQAIYHRLTPLSDIEQHRYWRDQIIQDRGCHLDLDFINKALALAHEEKANLDERMRDVTSDIDTGKPAVSSTTATKQLVDWLKAGGVEWPKETNPSVDKENLVKLLARDDLTNSQREAVLLRQEANKTSTAKLDRAIKQVCDDGSVKGQLQFNGAGATGRDSARGCQFQNFPRPAKGIDVKQAIADIKAGLDLDWVRSIHGPPMSVISSCLRGIFVARPGHQLFTRDQSQIEARMTAWLGGQTNLVEAFRRYDTVVGYEFNKKGERVPITAGPDIYIVTAAGIYNVPASSIGKDDLERQVGKVAALALGFGGGASAFGGMAKIYFLDLDPLLPIVWEMATPENREKATEAWKARGRKSGMHKAAWIAAELIKLAWREANPGIVGSWKELEDGAVTACMRPGQSISCLGGKVIYRKTGSWLRTILPSGRSLFYAFPTLVSQPTPWGKQKMQIRFKAVNGMTRQWQDFHLYGGLQFQNCVQAASRDTFWEAIDRCEDAGYENLLRVHDEGIFEVPNGSGDEDEFHRLFTQSPAWAPDLPIASDGWVGPTYRK